jgi:HPt (histidine-containing phosphotransfer) domain-containing protein
MLPSMSAEADADFFARLSVLNDKFAATLPLTLGRLAQTRAQLDPAAPSAALVGELHAVLHTLAGSAATFGFRRLGQQARLLEQRLRVFTTFDVVAPQEWEDWLGQLDVFVAWGQGDPKSAYPNDEAAV